LSPTDRATPGVFITERSAVNAIAGVQTAVPAFIGYTAKAVAGGRSAYFTPVLVNSMAEFEAAFGAAFTSSYDIVETSPAPGRYDFTAARWNAAAQAFAPKYYALVRSGGAFNLYNSLRLFYANGGGPCYVVSIGDYTDDGRAPGGVVIDAGKLTQGLTAIGAQAGPTMLIVPDAVLLTPDARPAHGLLVSAAFNALVQAMLAQCGALQDRVAILDVYGADALKPDPNGGVSNSALGYLAETFQNGVGDSSLGYGMAYFPFLKTTLVQPDDIDYRHFNIGKPDQLALLQGILTDTAAQLYPDLEHADPAQNRDPRFLKIKDLIAAIVTTTEASAIARLNQDLGVAIPLLRQMETVIATALNLLPPSGAIAGIYALVDATRGVWTAPANMAPVAVTAPSIRLNDQQQRALNGPVNGKAINAVRDFVGRGTLVWGARTLDANNNEYRYVPVRRTLIYVEQSIKGGLMPFTFEPNDANTWTAVIAVVTNFLFGLWQPGGLQGATPKDAFAVKCGLGSTMTAQDILEGNMMVDVMMAMVRPAEFIVLRIQQKMERGD